MAVGVLVIQVACLLRLPERLVQIVGANIIPAIGKFSANDNGPNGVGRRDVGVDFDCPDAHSVAFGHAFPRKLLQAVAGTIDTIIGLGIYLAQQGAAAYFNRG